MVVSINRWYAAVKALGAANALLTWCGQQVIEPDYDEDLLPPSQDEGTG